MAYPIQFPVSIPINSIHQDATGLHYALVSILNLIHKGVSMFTLMCNPNRFIPNRLSNLPYSKLVFNFGPAKYSITPTHINHRNHIHTCTNNIKNIKRNTNTIAPPGRNSSLPGGSSQNKNRRPSLMSRLAVGIKPPSGFWEKPRNPIEQCKKTGGRHVVSITKA